MASNTAYTEDGVTISIEMNGQDRPCRDRDFSVEENTEFAVKARLDIPSEKFKLQDSGIRMTLYCDGNYMKTEKLPQRKSGEALQGSFRFSHVWTSEGLAAMKFGAIETEVDNKCQATYTAAGKIKILLEEYQRLPAPASSPSAFSHKPAVIHAKTADIKPALVPALCVQLRVLHQEPKFEESPVPSGYQKEVFINYDKAIRWDIRWRNKLQVWRPDCV